MTSLEREGARAASVREVADWFTSFKTWPAPPPESTGGNSASAPPATP